MRKFIFILLFGISPCIAQSTHSTYWSNPRLYTTYIHNDSIQGTGVIDMNATWILPPEFESIFINDNRIAARKKGKWALFNTNGEQLTDFLYNDLAMETYGYGMNFIETMVDHWNYYGLIDTNGKEILPPVYTSLDAFYAYDHHKCITYCTGPNSCGVMDSNLQTFIPPIYDGFVPIYKEFMEVFKDGRTALFDYSGKQIGKDWYDSEIESIGFLIHGKFLPVELNNKFGILNLISGKYMVQPLYEKLDANFVTPGYPNFFYWENGLMGLMDTNGIRLTSPVYQDERVDYYTRNILVMKDSLWGLIDAKGNMKIPCEYNSLEYLYYDTNNVRGGMLKANKQNSTDYFYEDGSKEINHSPENVYQTLGNLMVIEKKGKYGVKNISGKIVIPFKYDYLNLLDAERIIVKKNGKYGLMNNSGKILAPFIYDEMEYQSQDSLLVVVKDHQWGAVDMNGNIILPLIYGYLYSTGYKRVILYNYYPVAGVMYSSPTFQGLADNKGGIIIPLDDITITNVFPNGASVFWDSGWSVVYVDPTGKLKKLE